MSKPKPDKSGQKSGRATLMAAISHPTDENTRTALEHPELKTALEGLSIADFKALSNVVTPYIVLRDVLHFHNERDLTAASAHPLLSSVIAKLDVEDLNTLHELVGGDSSRVPCR